jgi:hypothetical protein
VARQHRHLLVSGGLRGPSKTAQVISFCSSVGGELDKRYSMAGDVGDGHRGLDGCLAEEIQAELGILAVPPKQCVVDYLGSHRWSIRSYYLADLPCVLEYQGRSEE